MFKIKPKHLKKHYLGYKIIEFTMSLKYTTYFNE